MKLGTLAVAAGLIVSGFSLTSHAAWPERPIRFIAPYAAGGLTDTTARLTAQWLSSALKLNVIVENRTGANGAIAADLVARAPADGYTFFMTSSPPLMIVPHMQKVDYDPFKNFVPVSIINSGYFAIAVNPAFPAKTLPELLAYAKQEPSKLAYATGGKGDTGHLAMSLLLKRAGINLTHVPYKGSSAAAVDVMAGHVPVYVGTLTDALEYHRSGKLKIVGVSSLKRLNDLPDVPTIAEQGFPGYTINAWNGLLAPAGTPKAIIATLADAIKAACRDAGFNAKFQIHSVETLCTSSEQFAERMQADWIMWGDAVKASGVELQ